MGSVTTQTKTPTKTAEISTHTLRGERDLKFFFGYGVSVKFQLTRSVGSVTDFDECYCLKVRISTHTLRGERDISAGKTPPIRKISTHTLRGERDKTEKTTTKTAEISTHTLRGERDYFTKFLDDNKLDFNSHAPWGA